MNGFPDTLAGCLNAAEGDGFQKGASLIERNSGMKNRF
jgi:hypothetical protein